MDHKKNENFLIPFSLESITVNLVMLVDVFIVYETKFTVGKWQVVVVVFTAGKKRGMGWNSTIGSSAVLRSHGSWRTREIRGPDPT